MRKGEPIPEAKEQSSITANIYFAEMEAARDWGLSPSDWYKEPLWSRAAMVATQRQRRRIDYWLGEDVRKDG
jgi:hypothetical protein